MFEGKLGARLRTLRTERGLSVRTLAARTGFSPSFISQVESDSVSPSIASLEKIAGQLGVTLGQLFSSIEASPRMVVRCDDRVTHRSLWSRSVVEVLTDAAVERKLSAIQVTIESGGSSGKKIAPSLEDTVAFVLSGTPTLVTEDETYKLIPGDTAYLQEGDPFMWQNTGEDHAILLLISATGQNKWLSRLMTLSGGDADE